MARTKAKAKVVKGRSVASKGKTARKISGQRKAPVHTKTSPKKVMKKIQTSKAPSKRTAKPIANAAAKRMPPKKSSPRPSRHQRTEKSPIASRVMDYKGVLRPQSNFVAVSTQNEFLIKKMLDAGNSGDRCLLVQDVVYSLSDDLRELALKSGFNLGTEVYRNSSRDLSALERVLENAGLGRVIYYPFESKSIITSYKTKPREGANLGANVHVFESGLISGYLSANANRRIFVRESRCV